MRPIEIRPVALILALLLAASAGGYIAGQLPWGAKEMTYSQGTALMLPDGHGTFMPDGGSAILLPADIEWADRIGNRTSGGRPECLNGPDGGAESARVEAGHVRVRLPGGVGSASIVVWVRCL